jgi:hypothetical protein
VRHLTINNRPKDEPMNEELLALRSAALVVATKMLAKLSDGARQQVEVGTASGVKLALQLGPLPDCARVELVQIEPEGRRSLICVFETK